MENWTNSLEFLGYFLGMGEVEQYISYLAVNTLRAEVSFWPSMGLAVVEKKNLCPETVVSFEETTSNFLEVSHMTNRFQNQLFRIYVTWAWHFFINAGSSWACIIYKRADNRYWCVEKSKFHSVSQTLGNKYQLDALYSFLNGRDTFVGLPTG